ETQLERAEDQMFSTASTRDRLEHLYVLKRKLMTLKHAVAPLMEGVGKLYGGRVPQLCKGTQEYFRDVYDHLSRINGAIESSREMLTTATQVNLALITVPTLIAGIYGMNFKNMPELDLSLGYPLALGFMFAVDALLFWRFRLAKWI